MEPGTYGRALVTGAASGIGAATVARLLADGMKVAALDLDARGLASLDATCRVVADVSSEDDVRRAVDEAAAALGGLDTIVTCAGVALLGTVEASFEEWQRTFAVNVSGVYLVARAALPYLRAAGGGAIVNVASNLGLVATEGAAAYCASKGAVIQLTRAMALDHGREGIRVNAVCPGPTETPMVKGWLGTYPDPDAARAFLEQNHLHGRLIRPDEIAAAIAYLISPGASSVFGVVLTVDAGFTIR
ncbi:MAG: SDR family oxidoreductase [Thermoleophilia bacterium]|nr:SDR family oxidoreductase [Thermoleophilia bacterium]